MKRYINLLLVWALLTVAVLCPATVMFYAQDDTESQTSENTWQDKLVIQRTIDGPDSFLLWYSAEIKGELTNKAIAIRATMSGAELSRMDMVPTDSDNWYMFSGMKGMVLDGSQEFKIQYAVEAGTPAQTATIRRARVTVHKH